MDGHMLDLGSFFNSSSHIKTTGLMSLLCSHLRGSHLVFPIPEVSSMSYRCGTRKEAGAMGVARWGMLHTRISKAQ